MQLYVTLDVDQDGVVHDDRGLSFDSIAEIPRIAELFAARGVRATWFVRADGQIADAYGTPAHLLEQHDALWRSLASAGHEIAWHPHLYRRVADGAYVPETDPVACAEQLERLHEALTAAGRTFRVVRIGESFHSNQTMHAVDRLGYRIDATAIPGRGRADADRVFDWEPTPNEPYHPSVADYRVPGNPALRILEVPMTTVPILAPYDAAPLRRYVNLAVHPGMLRPGLGAFLGNGARVLATILHPDEVRPQKAHALLSNSLETVRENLDFILTSADVRSCVMSELLA